MKQTGVAASVTALSVFMGAASAQEASVNEAAETEETRRVAAAALLDPVSVTASKAERLASQVPASVTVITTERLENELVENLRDLVRYEPGVTVPYQGSRFGNAGINIRGLGANRVQIEIDGIAIADSFAIGSFSNAGRDAVDFDTLKRVEIVRGPASSIYGSDALGGVVAFTTKDPRDYLDKNAHLGGSVRLGYFGADETFAGSATGAFARGNWSGLVNVVRRQGHELDNAGEVGGMGGDRTQPNPAGYSSTNFLAKLLWNEAGGAPLRLVLDSFENDSDSNALSAVGPVSSSVVTTELTGDDQVRRRRASLDQTLRDLLGFETLSWRIYAQDSRTRQDTFEARTVTTPGTGAVSERQRERRALFEQVVIGGEGTLTREFSTGPLGHNLIAGLEVETTRTRQLRDGLERNLTTGTETKTVGPDSFPVRDFPITDTLEGGFYFQDDVRYGRFTLIPGVRVDHYDLDPRPDATFTDDNPGIRPEGLNKTQVSPKLGLVAVVTDNLSVYGQYAEGFRAPPYSDVNVGFTNLAFGYTAIPNPDLKPETSRGFELGLRGLGSDYSYSLAAYRNKYDDFIESFVALGVDPASGLLVFQSQNLSRVTIEGIEFKAQLGLRGLTPFLKDFQLRTSIAYAHGDDDSADQPLNSVEPLTAVLGIAWEPSALPVSLELVATAVDGKSRVDDSNGPLFRSPGQVRLDLLAHWSPLPKVDINVGIFNLAGRRLYNWSDVQGRPAFDPAIDRFTQPGVNAGVNLRVRF